MIRPLCHLALVSLALVSAQSAQTLTGRVVDSNGVGVPNVDIDVVSASGPDPAVSADFTIAGGFFTTTVSPAGIFDIHFTPPAPPTTTHLRVEHEGVVVVGTVDLGTIVLPAGVTVSGRVVSGAAVPLGNVDLDCEFVASGQDVPLSGDNSTAFGLFSLAVPRGQDIRLQFDPRLVVGGTYAPRELVLNLSANTNLGDVVLPNGVTLTATLQSNGVPLFDADVDLTDTTTGQDLYLVGDNTNASGLFSTVVPAGTYDARYCPRPGDLVQVLVVPALNLSANTNLGIIPMAAGVALTGSVSDCRGAPAPNTLLAVTRNGISVPLCRRSTDANGNYAVVVPTGTLAATFQHATLGSAFQASVPVSGATVLNATLNPMSVTIRNGTVPNQMRYTNLSEPRLGTTWSTEIDCSGVSQGLALQTGRSQAINGPVIAPYGQVLITGGKLFSLVKPHSGNVVRFDLALPNIPSLCGLAVYTQGLANGPGGTARATNAIDIVLGP